MPIIYSLCGRGGVVLAEHAVTSGNFKALAAKIIDKLQQQTNTRMTYVYDKYDNPFSFLSFS
jgi:hypothetical protein